MKEALLRKKSTHLLQSQGWVVWFLGIFGLTDISGVVKLSNGENIRDKISNLYLSCL